MPVARAILVLGSVFSPPAALGATPTVRASFNAVRLSVVRAVRGRMEPAPVVPHPPSAAAAGNHAYHGPSGQGHSTRQLRGHGQRVPCPRRVPDGRELRHAVLRPGTPGNVSLHPPGSPRHVWVLGGGAVGALASGCGRGGGSHGVRKGFLAGEPAAASTSLHADNRRGGDRLHFGTSVGTARRGAGSAIIRAGAVATRRPDCPWRLQPRGCPHWECQDDGGPPSPSLRRSIIPPPTPTRNVGSRPAATTHETTAPLNSQSGLRPNAPSGSLAK